MSNVQIEISNRKGLHARSSAKVVKIAEAYDACVIFSYQGRTAEATSIMDLLMLGAGQGAQVSLSAQGPEAYDAIKALCSLIEMKFEEE